MNDELRIIEELSIGDKKRRWQEIMELQKNMDHMDPRLIPLMEESTALLKDMSAFMENFCNNIIEDHEKSKEK